MVHNKATQAYRNVDAQTSVNIARPENLILLVFQKLMDHLHMAEVLLESGELANEPIDKAIDIFQIGLIPALDPDKGGDVARNLANLYDWSIRHLLKAKINKDVQLVRETRTVLAPVVEAWQTIVAGEASLA